VKPAAPAIAASSLLIRTSNWLGDIIMSLPTIQAVVDLYAGARIAVWTGRAGADLLADAPWRAETINTGGPAREEVRAVRAGRFDLGLLLPNSFSSALSMRLGGVRKRVGFPTECRRVLLSEPVHLPLGSLHQADVFFALGRALGAEGPRGLPVVEMGDEARGFADRFLDERGLAGSPVVAIHPGGAKVQRRWPAERFARLARRVAEAHGAAILLVGGPGDEDAVAASRPAASTPTLTSCGVREMAAVLSRCRLFIGNDSGLAHLAGTVGAPVVGIFGTSRPALTGPLTPPGNLEAVASDLPCSPCRERFFRECRPVNEGGALLAPCLHAITVDAVAEAVERLWQRTCG